MSKRITIRPRASQDIDDHFAYLARNSSETAFQFFDAVRLTIAQIARMPGIGVAYSTQNARLIGLRKWSVKDFKRYIIFYLDLEETVEVVRILYGSRDISSILGREG
jgi:toxin ParE1/3/4